MLANPEGVCQTCQANTTKCLSCGKPITGRYVEIDGKGPYCLVCYEQQATCDVCAIPLGSGDRWRLSDGRVICPDCHATAVFEAAEAVKIYQDIQDLARKHLDLSLNVPTGLILVDRDNLTKICYEQSGEAYPPQALMGIYVRRGMRRAIYIQNALPSLIFTQVSAHEFGHAWQAENNPLTLQIHFREGFAEWVAYKVLQTLGKKEQMERMLWRNDVYGQGLRWALSRERRVGASGFLREVRDMR
jgi:hypothetical protein